MSDDEHKEGEDETTELTQNQINLGIMKGKYFEGVMSLDDSSNDRGHVKISEINQPVII